MDILHFASRKLHVSRHDAVVGLGDEGESGHFTVAECTTMLSLVLLVDKM